MNARDEIVHAIMWKKLPFGGTGLFISLDANAAHTALELIAEQLRSPAAVERVARAIGKVQYGNVYMHIPADMHPEGEACAHCLDLDAARAAITALLGEGE